MHKSFIANRAPLHAPGLRIRNMSVRRQVVAIVDDDPSMLTGLVRLLRASGHDTEAFASAEAFLHGVAESKATCLVLDIHLGGISGIELSRRLAATGSKLPIIFMTAVDSEVVQREALKTKCIAFLRKPFPSRYLIDAIGKVGGEPNQ